jgi:hypothetical protein
MPLTNNALKLFKRGNVFIETGTLYGDGVVHALDADFSKVISIDIDPSLVQAAKTLFSQRGAVEIILGDSKKVLGEVLSRINETCTFWLDSHWDMGPVCGEVVCPLYDELTAIKNHPIKNHLILIDDMRIVGNSSHHWGKMVQKQAIIDMIKQINPQYNIAYTDGDLGPNGGGIVASDIMVAFV